MSDVIKVVVSVSTGMVGSTNKDEFKNACWTYWCHWKGAR